jgi:hypothetical protein
MQRHARPLRKALQTMRYHLTAQIANLLTFQAKIYDGEGAVGEVDNGTG